MKRIISIVLAVALAFSMAACGESAAPEPTDVPDGDLPEVYSQSVTVPDYPLPYVVAQDVTALAAQQYITARFYLDALLKMELNAGTEAEYSSLLDEAIAQFALADEYAEQALLAADLAQMYVESELSASGVAYAANETGGIVLLGYKTASGGISGTPQIQLLAEEDGDALKEWAEDITSKFDALQGSQRCKALGEQLGMDAREAYNQLLAAQAIIKQGADADAAFYDTAMKAAMVVKTTCKITVIAGTAIATGGASTLLEGAALVVSGSSAIIEVAATTSTIILGESSGLTLAYNKVQDAMAPVEAVLGLLTLDFSSAAKLSTKTDEAGAALVGAIDYVGNGLRDFFQDGKIMGLQKKDLAQGSKMLTAGTIDVAAFASDTGTDTKKTGQISDAFESAGMEGVAGVIDAAAAAGAATEPVPPLEAAKTFVPEVPIEEVKKAVQQVIKNSGLDLGNFDLGLKNSDLAGLYSITGIPVGEKYKNTMTITPEGAGGTVSFGHTARYEFSEGTITFTIDEPPFKEGTVYHAGIRGTFTFTFTKAEDGTITGSGKFDGESYGSNFATVPGSIDGYTLIKIG